MRIHRENLIEALVDAIKAQEDREREKGFISESAYIAGLKSLLKHLVEERGTIEFYE